MIFVDWVNGNGYYGLVEHTGENEFIRTTANGFIPYTSGNILNGHSYLGTSNWVFYETNTTNINSYNYKCAGIAGQITQVASTAPGTVNMLWAY